MARYVIDTGDLKLDKKQVKALEHALQETAGKHLMDMARIGPVVAKFPFPWSGGIWGNTIEEVAAVEEKISGFLG